MSQNSQNFNSITNSQSSSQNSNSANSSQISQNQTPPILKLQDILEFQNVKNTESKETKISPNMVQKTQDSKAENQKTSKKITKIQTFKYQNPFYVSPQDEQKRKNEIEVEKNKALEHNKKYKQNYLIDQYKEMLKAGTAPDPSIYQFSVEKNGQEISKNEIKNLQDEVKNAWIGPVLGSIKAEARGLNNSVAPLLIYSWDNSGLTFDVPNGNTNNGTQLAIYGRHGSWNQTFSFDNNTNRISINGKCLDMFGGTNANAQIGLWNCHSGDNQKWIFNGVNLQPMTNQNLCLEPQGGLSEGGRLILWHCNGTSPQRWVSGRNDFNSSFSINIHASKTDLWPFNFNPGHVLLSYKIDNNLVNTQSSWPGYDTDCSSNNGNVNNICDNDAAYIDKIDDWDYVRYNNSAFKTKTSYISKRLSDVYRYNSSYRAGYMSNYNYSWYYINQYNGNCATFSVRIWNNIMSYSGYSQLYPNLIDYPSAVYDII